MLKKLLINISAATLFLGCLFCFSGALGQTVTLASAPGNAGQRGLSDSPLYPQSDVVMYGLRITVSGTTTITQINIPSAFSNLSTLFSNARLVRSTTDSYNSGAVTQVAGTGTPGTAVNIGSNSITVTGLSESISNTARWYYLVMDYVYSGTSTFADNAFTNPVVTYGSGSTVTAYAGSPYYSLRPISLTLDDVSGGLTPAGTIYPQSGAVLYGFSAVTPGGSATVTQFAISGTNNSLSTYFSNAKLYRSNINSYDGTAVQIAGVGVGGTNATVNAANITFSGISETITTSPAKYYFVVLDYTYSGTTNSSVQFHTITSTFSTGGVVSYPNNHGLFYTLNGNSFSVNAINGGTAASDLYYGQSNLALFGFSVTSLGTTTIATFNIQSTNNSNLSNFFTGKLYSNTTTTYGSGTATEIGTATFSSSGVSITGLTEQFTAGQAKHYFLVVTDIYYSATTVPQVQFNIDNNTTNSFVTAGGQAYKSTNTANSATYNLRRPAPTLTVTGVNAAINGITQGSLSYGQTAIVLFGFKVEALGVITIDQLRIQTNVPAGNFFTNGKLYRSTTPYFANATQVSGTFSFQSETTINSMSEAYTTYNSPTTYYYFIVADLTATTQFTPGTFQYNFANGQTTFVQSANPYIGFTNISTTNGVVFNIVNAYRWTGNVSNAFNVAGNFTDLSGNIVSVPGSGTMVQVGVVAYTRPPIVTSNMTIGGITFGTQSTPTLTVNSGFTLTMDRGLNLINATTATVNGPGAITITNAATSTIGTGATLNLSNIAVSNAGTFTASPTSVINLTNNATITNTGTFTLASNINGTAAIGPISGTSTINGNVTVQRYVSGGAAAYRGYRLFSSPIYEAIVGTNNVYGVAYTKNSAYLTGTTGTTGGFDATSSTPTIYLYREDKAPSSSPIGGNFRGINKINNSPTYNLNLDNEIGFFNIPVGNGFMFFFRGDRATNASTSTTVVPDPVIFSQTGTLNKGNIVVKNWYTPTSSNLGYTASAAVSSRGYNLLGNPYPSTIDWNVVKNNATGLGPTIYVYNSRLKTYGTYNGTTGTSDGSRYIPSGQGFYVVANSTSAALTFTESAKVASQQLTGTSLLMGTPVNDAPVAQFLRLELSRDEFNREDMVVQFNKTASDGFLFDEDSQYLRGSNVVSLSSVANDNKDMALAINQVPFPKKRISIPLNVAVNTTSLYQLKLTETKNIPKIFEVWLMDAYKKDSLDIKNNTTYNFNVDIADATTYGANRFSLVVRPNTAYSYHLLDFAATKQTKAVQITWKAENEENYTYFTVERSIDKGKTFEVIGSEVGKSLGNYSVEDKAPAIGENQYRLKQEDYFGTISYSNIIPVMYTPAKDLIADDRLITVYPNPSSANLNITIKPNGNANVYSISFINTSGHKVKTLTSLQPDWRGSVSDLLPGTYFIQVINTKDNSVVGRSTFIKI